MVALLFPGQGAQHRGMGEGLFERYPALVAAADAELGYPVATLCLSDPDDRLRDTRYAQPALFVVEVLSYLAYAEDAPPPDFLAGHSVGEYAALFAAGAIDFATGVRLVRRRGELMSAAGGGGMLAVLGPAAARIDTVLGECGRTDVDVANHNSADQVVLSGPQDALRAVAGAIGAGAGSRCVPLRVSAAFHSRYMDPVAEAFRECLAGMATADPVLPVISNVTARPYPPGRVSELLVAQVRRPVRWAESMDYLLDRGVAEAVELGPGRVLTGLWRSARRPRSGANGRPPDAAGSRSSVNGSRPGTRTVLSAEPRTAPSAETLGSAEFRRDYDLRYAYLAGAMFRGIASTDLVIRLGRAGLLGFFGAGGLSVAQIEAALGQLRRELGEYGRFGMNLLCTLDDPGYERAVVDLYLREGVRQVEAAAYPQLTAALVRYRFAGAHHDRQGQPVAVNRVVAKVSRPEVAAAFLRPPPAALLDRLVADGGLTRDEAAAAARLPVSEDLCVEADSAGHTDGGVALTLLPSMVRLRDEVCAGHGYARRPRVGASGGLGTPEALAAVFVLGADFVLTGSVNQCTPEAGTSEAVKRLLAGLDVQDTGYAPAGDMFELGAQVQVVRKGTLFPARANRLYQLYRQHRSLEEIDGATRRGIERDYFGQSFGAVWAQTRDRLAARDPRRLAAAERDPRQRMALVFRWYFWHSTELALAGTADQQVNYQIHCGPAMGAFNRWAKGTDLEDWRRRHPDVIAERLMSAAAAVLADRLGARG